MTQLLQLLDVYQPTSEEVLTKERMVAFVKEYPNCFERTLSVGHITGSAWLLSKEGEQVLLTLHAKIHMWAQLGGHCDGDPDVLRTALREAREESGIQGIVPVSTQIFDIDIHAIPAVGTIAAHLHYDVRFLLQVTSDESFVINHESKSLQWFGRDPRLLPTQNRSVLRMHEKWLKLSQSTPYKLV